MHVRDRRPDDLPALVDLLAAQQPQTDYPLRWPLPFPAEQFLVRAGEERAWVGEEEGRLLGHVAVGTVGAELVAPLTEAAGTGLVTMVSVLFVAAGATGRGVGGLLHDTAVAHVRARGRVPVLDVVPVHEAALGLYRRRGWREVGRVRPGWLPEHRPDLLLMVLDAPG